MIIVWLLALLLHAYVDLLLLELLLEGEAKKGWSLAVKRGTAGRTFCRMFPSNAAAYQ